MSSFHDVKMPAKNSPFRNIKITVDGRLFDSKGEAKRYVALRGKQQAGQIEGLRCQVPFRLFLNGVYDCTYIADFVYQQDGKEVVEDYKGILTETFKRKRKLMKQCLGIKILITRKANSYSEIGKRRPVKKKIV